MAVDVSNLSNLFRAIGDSARLRLLHLLAASELTVGELVRILDLPQSSVSRHLKALKEEGLIADRPVGSATYYRAALEADRGNGREAALRDALSGLLRSDTLPPADRERLDQSLALRKSTGTDDDQFFDRIGLRWDALREQCFGPSFHLEAFIRLLPSDWTVADLGTGTGYLLPVLGQHFRRVIGVDMSQSMLDHSARRVREAGSPASTAVELKAGTLEALPLPDHEIDLALAILMLHHLPDTAPALAEIGRTLRPGGRLLLIEIYPHTNESFRVAMADRRPGIDPASLTAALTAAGFGQIETWDFPYRERPEHELAPLPRLYGMLAVSSAVVSPSGNAPDSAIIPATPSNSEDTDTREFTYHHEDLITSGRL